MHIPNAEQAIIPESKLRAYLLNLEHHEGGSKARVFHALGYSPANWRILQTHLIEQHLTKDFESSEQTQYGQVYVIVAQLEGPAGSAMIRSIWIVEFGSNRPRLVTAYPS